jgi:hypothetical protein
MGSGTDFFATRSDLENGLKEVETKYRLKYVRLLTQTTPTFDIYTSALDIPDLGSEESLSVLNARTFLVFYASDEISVRERKDKYNNIYFSVDYEDNPDAILLRPGGLYKDRCILTGYIHTAGVRYSPSTYSYVRNEASIALYQSFRRLLLKQFLPMPNWLRGWKIGPDARQKAENGIRLITMDVNEDPIADAQI